MAAHSLLPLGLSFGQPTVPGQGRQAGWWSGGGNEGLKEGEKALATQPVLPEASKTPSKSLQFYTQGINIPGNP